MKRTIGIIFGAALLMCACNTERLAYEACDEAITFKAYAGGVTKTAALSSSTLTSFGATAYTGSVKILDNQEVSGGNGSWSYSPIKYWPQSGALYFSAYAPFATAANGITPSYNTTTRTFDLTYALPASEANQVDLLMASNVDVADCSDRPSTVQFTFGHILSRVGLTARYTGTVSSGTTVTLTDVKVSGKFVASGDYTVSGGWDNRAASATDLVYDRPAAKLAATALTTSAQNLLAGDNYVMVIPNESEVEVNGTITVYYTVTTSDGVAIDYVKDASSALVYEPNKTYTYNLIIDLDADAIEFGDVTVSDWGTTVSMDVEMRSFSGNIQVAGLSFSPARRNAQFYVRSTIEYEDGEVVDAPWHAEFSTDGGLNYGRSVPNFFDSIDNSGEGTDTYSASSSAQVGQYVDVKFIQDIEMGSSIETRARILPIIETADSLIRGYHLRNVVLNKNGDDWSLKKVTNPIDYLDWAQNDVTGRYFSFGNLSSYFNTSNNSPINPYGYTLVYSNNTISYNDDTMIVPTPGDWANIRTRPTDKGVFINGMLTRSHFAMIQVDLSETEYSELTNGENNCNKGYLNGLLIFPDEAIINIEHFTLTCDNNNDCPLNNAINFTVYDCTKNQLTLYELTSLMAGGCVFLPCIYNEPGSGNGQAAGWNYSKNGLFWSNTRNNNSPGMLRNCLAIFSASTGYDVYTLTTENMQNTKTLIYMIPQEDSREYDLIQP